MNKNIKWLCLVALTIVACSKDCEVAAVPEASASSDGQPLTAGTANFAKYVAVGNSLTAGYSDGTLFIEGQKGAWSTLLANKFADVGGGEFKIPFMADNVGGFKIGGAVFQGPRLFWNGSAPTPAAGVPSTEITTRLTGPFNNMGVPGAKSFHLLAPGYGSVAGLPANANPFFVRFASSNTATVLGDAVAQAPTFFSLWIGNNDVLGYAISGGTGTNQTGNLNPATYGPNDITDPNVFASVYNTLLDGTNGLTKGGAKGVVSNIPSVTSVPFFTTVPHNPIPGLPAAAAGGLNQIFGGINAALAGAGLPARFVTLSTTEANPLLIVDESQVNIAAQITAAFTPTFGPATAGFLGSIYGQARHARNNATARDYILLTARGVIGTTQAAVPASFSTIGVSYPMQDATTLTDNETMQVKTATDAYNATILALATAKGLAFVNANAALAQVASTGVTANGFTVSSSYVVGGGFSLDGVHPSPRGYALIANEFMKSINAKYGSNLKAYDLSTFRIQFPSSL
ncbi:MAG: hypothetical protein RLZZ312_1778 [Bacteroidota bacterium]|jgi:lysophospholipase L1-like esterase